MFSLQHGSGFKMYSLWGYLKYKIGGYSSIVQLLLPMPQALGAIPELEQTKE